MSVEHVKGPLRNSPSGPLADLLNNTTFYYATNVAFGPFTADDPGQQTVEASRVLYTLNNQFGLYEWDLFTNPNHYDNESPPSWMPDWSLSHVRISEFDVNINALDPAVPVGVLGVRVSIGMSYLKATLTPVVLQSAPFDLMFLKQGNVVLVAPDAPPSP